MAPDPARAEAARRDPRVGHRRGRRPRPRARRGGRGARQPASASAGPLFAAATRRRGRWPRPGPCPVLVAAAERRPAAWSTATGSARWFAAPGRGRRTSRRRRHRRPRGRRRPPRRWPGAPSPGLAAAVGGDPGRGRRSGAIRRGPRRLDGDGLGAAIELDVVAHPRRRGRRWLSRSSSPSAAPAAARAGSACAGSRELAGAGGRVVVPGHGLAGRPRAGRPDRPPPTRATRRLADDRGRHRPGRGHRRRPTRDEPVLLDGLTLWLSAILGDDTTSDAIDPLLDGPVAAAFAAIDRRTAAR